MSKFQLQVSLHESYLVGGIYEYEPALSVYASWSGGRYSRTAELTASSNGAEKWQNLGEYTLPVATESNQDDEVLSFTAFSQTRTSGIAPIDEKEGKIVQRMIPTGVEKVDLRELLRTGGSAPADVLLSSPMVLRDARDHAIAGREIKDIPTEEREQIGREVMLLAAKLWLKVKVTILDHAAVNAWLTKGRPRLRERCLYFDERTPTRVSAALSSLEASYVVRLTDFELSDTADAPTRIPWNPNEPISKDLHFYSGETPSGPLIPVAWTLQDVQTRIGVTALALEAAATPKQTAQFLESSLLGALWASGMDGATFTRIVSEQCHEHRRHDAQMLSSFRTAAGAVLSVATLVANQALYASDMEYPNVHALREMTAAKQAIYAPGLVKSGLLQRRFSGSTALLSLPPQVRHDRVWNEKFPLRVVGVATPKLCHKCKKMHSRHRTYVGAPPLRASTSATASYESTVAVTGDRWDTTINSQDTTTADCEEGGFGITANLDALEVFLEHFQEIEKRPILAAAHQVLRRFTFMANGASSTEPYVAANATKTQAHVPLPVIGSEEDKKWAENGHGFATVQTKASWAAAVLRGLHVLPLKDEREHDKLVHRLERDVDAAESWLGQLRPFVLEGTGPTSMEVLSVEEIYAGTDRAQVYMRKTAAKMQFLKRLRHMDKTDAIAMAFSDVKHESLPYELYTPLDASSRRSHPFYRTIMHVVNPKAAREFGGTLGQVAAVNLAPAVGRSASCPQRGVPVGDFGRMSRNMAYVPAYGADFTTREWNEKIQSPMNCIMNLQQASTWARAPVQFPPKTAQLVTRSAFAGLAKTASTLLGVSTALNALPVVHSSLPSDEAAALALVVNADASDRHVTFQCFLPAWQVVASAHKLQGLLDAMDSLKTEGTVAAALIVREQPLWRCAATLRLIMVLNVAETIDSSIWPRPIH